MRDNIVDYNVMHTMTCRIMNSMQQFLININFYHFRYLSRGCQDINEIGDPVARLLQIPRCYP